MSCHSCDEVLGCAVDCPNAPWNWDLAETTAKGHLKRLVKWVRNVIGPTVPLGFTMSELSWVRRN